MTRPSGPTAEQIDAAAQALVDAVAERDARTPEDAARAAGARTPEAIAALAADIRRRREQQHLRRTA